MKKLAKGAFILAGMFGLGMWLVSQSNSERHARAMSAEEKQTLALTPAEKQPPAAQVKKNPVKFDVEPPPADVNDLSMEVAALRTLYLMSAWPDHGGRDAWMGIQDRVKEISCADPRTPRKKAVASAKYIKVLTDLRAAYILGQDDRIIDLTEELDDLADEESVELDDTIEDTHGSRKMALRAVGYFSPEQVVNYFNAYGRDFPDPKLIVESYFARKDSKGEKPTPETRAFVIKEVTWLFGGIDQTKQKPIADKMAKLLDKADKMTNEERENAWRVGGPLRHDFNQIKGGHGPMEILHHVLDQDVAELLANPRIQPAMESRIAYLKKAGYNMERVKYEE
jgi:hypothetical protein